MNSENMNRHQVNNYFNRLESHFQSTVESRVYNNTNTSQMFQNARDIIKDLDQNLSKIKENWESLICGKVTVEDNKSWEIIEKNVEAVCNGNTISKEDLTDIKVAVKQLKIK